MHVDNIISKQKQYKNNVLEDRKIGKYFRIARKEKNITIQQASKDTFIKEDFIKAIENDDFSVIGDHTYTKNFFKIYAEYLDLDAKKLIHMYTKNYEILDLNHKENNKKKLKLFSRDRKEKIINKAFFLKVNLRKLLTIIIFVLPFLIFLFSFFSIIFKKPYLEITEPLIISSLDMDFYDKRGIYEYSTQQNFIKISGKTEENAIVTVDNAILSINKLDNTFTTREIPIIENNKVLHIKAQNNFGISTDIYLKVNKPNTEDLKDLIIVRSNSNTFIYIVADNIVRHNGFIKTDNFELIVEYYREIFIRTDDFTKIKLFDKDLKEINISSNEFTLKNKNV